MKEYTFRLRIRLGMGDPTERDEIARRLASAGCSDALVGLGVRGRIALDFTRKAGSPRAAVRSAIRDAGQALPGAELIDVEEGPVS